jgi:hypothetical protein
VTSVITGAGRKARVLPSGGEVPRLFTLSEAFRLKGIKDMDSLHLAAAEHFGIDILLTTDDRFERNAKKIKAKSRVVNPVTWLMEVLRNER